MTTVKVSIAGFRDAAMGAAKHEIEKAVVDIQRDLVVKLVEIATDLGHTWSANQPNANWSGRYQASLRARTGSPDPGFAPANPGPWPHHPNPLPAPTNEDVMVSIGYLEPYQIVWVSDNAPHAGKVEAHTSTFAIAERQIIEAAAEFARSYFQKVA